MWRCQKDTQRKAEWDDFPPFFCLVCCVRQTFVGRNVYECVYVGNYRSTRAHALIISWFYWLVFCVHCMVSLYTTIFFSHPSAGRLKTLRQFHICHNAQHSTTQHIHIHYDTMDANEFMNLYTQYNWPNITMCSLWYLLLNSIHIHIWEMEREKKTQNITDSMGSYCPHRRCCCCCCFIWCHLVVLHKTLSPFSAFAKTIKNGN